MKYRRLLSVLLLAGLLVGMLTCASFAETGTGFYRVSGRQILDPEGEPVVLRGIHFNNGVYQKPDSADDYVITVDHTAESYVEAAEMGLNHVRLALNYQLFEDDDAPYVYKEDGFAVIDRNLEWAKAAGVDIILQMKWPQGGYQMETEEMYPSDSGIGNGGKGLWLDIDPDTGKALDTENYKENQARLTALWTAIAQRYADEPAIIGYNLFNEPVVPEKETREETVAQLRDLMQRIADGIRAVDDNHILFVERLVGWFNAEDPSQTNRSLMSIEDTQYLIDDDNTVYEFHFYEPFTFTHQGSSWLPQFPAGVYYPSAEVMSYEVESWVPLASAAATSTGETENGWTYFQSEPFAAGVNSSGESYNFAHVQAAASGIAAGESVWYDDLTVTRIDSEGNETVLYSYDFSDGLGQFQWGGSYDMNGTAAFALDSDEGHDGAGSLRISDSAGGNYADIGSGDWFYLEEGCTYRVSGWVKGSNGGQYPMVNAIHAENVLLMGKDYVESMLLRYASFGETNGVPVYVGEWGLHYATWEYGYESYVQDVSQLLEEHSLSSTYYTYRDETFGMYICGDWEETGERNEELYDLLVTWYGQAEEETEEPEAPEEPSAPSIGTVTVEGTSVTVEVTAPQGGSLIAAAYDGEGRFLGLVSAAVAGEAQSVTLEVPAGGGCVKLFLVEPETWTPLCAGAAVQE